MLVGRQQEHVCVGVEVEVQREAEEGVGGTKAEEGFGGTEAGDGNSVEEDTLQMLVRVASTADIFYTSHLRLA